MSKSIVIQESGVNKTLNSISKINTNVDGSGSADWVPQEEVNLGEITITTNDTEVKAETEGYYAFSKVVVQASGKAVGKDKNGNWKVISVDNNQHFVEHELPNRIAVVTPPTKTAYSQDEEIKISGMVVKAYYSDNGEYGIVRNSQLTISPTKATGTTVTVKWKRDGDRQELTTTFEITVS